MTVTLATEARCEDFKAHFAKFDYLWKQDLQATLQSFIAENGVTTEAGAKADPPLAKFEEQVRAAPEGTGLLAATHVRLRPAPDVGLAGQRA